MSNIIVRTVLAVVLAITVGAATAAASEVTGTLSTGVNVGAVAGIVVAVPTASPAAGTYTSTQSVSLTAASSQSIHYTTDDSTPTCSTGSTYASAISVSTSQTIKAISCYLENASSTVASFAYVINTTASGGSVSIGGGGGGWGSPAPAATSTTVTTTTTTTTTTGTPAAPSMPTLPPNPTRSDLQTYLNGLIQYVAYLQARLQAQQGAAAPTAGQLPSSAFPPSGRFTRALALGSQGPDVTALQNLLKALGFFSGSATGYYGSLTQKAVQAFQVKYGLARAGQVGYGNVGPATRAKLNQLLQGSR